MYEENFNRVMQFMFPTEGGYSNLKVDFGGPTNLGVTQTTFNAWRKMNKQETEDVRNITKDEATKIYYNMYWKASGADKQKDIRDSLMLFDTAVQYGDVEAKRMFKKSGENFYNMLDMRRERYKDRVEQMPSQKVFIEGWLNRMDNLEKHVEALVKEDSGNQYEKATTPMINELKKMGISSASKDHEKFKNKYFYMLNKGQETGFSAPVDDSDYDSNYGASIKDITFANEDIGKLSGDAFRAVEHIINDQLRGGRSLSKSQAEEQVKSGGLVWVKEYLRPDGVKVKGHYRKLA